MVRRKSAKQSISGWKFYSCNAPAETDWKTLARLTAGRWPIETTFEEGKGQLGIDHYEVRNWRGWHHHMTLTLLSHHFLVRLRVKMGEDAPALTIAQVRQLLQVTLPKRTFDASNVLDETTEFRRKIMPLIVRIVNAMAKIDTLLNVVVLFNNSFLLKKIRHKS